MKFKPTKWATHKYSEDEAEAQRIWQRAEKRRSNILDGLQTCNWPVKREEYHKLLDKRLDQIERSEQRARDLFTEVEESFNVSEATIKL
jgi:hypothetical protein